MGYRWDGPAEWLLEKAEKENETGLRSIIRSLVKAMYPDDLIDIFQEEMLKDGYFDEEAKDSKSNDDDWPDDEWWNDGLDGDPVPV